jgi:hypothetical protein
MDSLPAISVLSFIRAGIVHWTTAAAGFRLGQIPMPRRDNSRLANRCISF